MKIVQNLYLQVSITATGPMVFVCIFMTHAQQTRLTVICIAVATQINAAAGKNYKMHVRFTPMEYKRIFHDKLENWNVTWKTRVTHKRASKLALKTTRFVAQLRGF